MTADLALIDALSAMGQTELAAGVIATSPTARTCANCDNPVPSYKRWCSDRCYRREDEGR